MENFTITVEVKKEDEIALQKYYLKKDKSLGSKTFFIIIAAIVIIGLGLIIQQGIQNKVHPLVLVYVVTAIVLVLGFYALLPFVMNKISAAIGILIKKFTPQSRTKEPDIRTYKIAEEGLSGVSLYGEVLFEWDKIKSLEENQNYIFISSDKYGIHIIPKRYFASPDEAVEFMKILNEKIR